MTEQERISQIEHSLADLERQLYDLKFEVKDIKVIKDVAREQEDSEEKEYQKLEILINRLDVKLDNMLSILNLFWCF